MGVLEAILAFAGIVGTIFAVFEAKFTDEFLNRTIIKDCLIKFGYGFGGTLAVVFAAAFVVYLAKN